MTEYLEVYESRGLMNVRSMQSAKKIFLVELDDFLNDHEELFIGGSAEGLTFRLDMGLPRIRTDTAFSAGDKLN